MRSLLLSWNGAFPVGKIILLWQNEAFPCRKTPPHLTAQNLTHSTRTLLAELLFCSAFPWLLVQLLMQQENVLLLIAEGKQKKPLSWQPNHPKGMQVPSQDEQVGCYLLSPCIPLPTQQTGTRELNHIPGGGASFSRKCQGRGIKTQKTKKKTIGKEDKRIRNKLFRKGNHLKLQ